MDMKQEILSKLTDHPWQKYLHCYDTIGSTNDIAKEMARNGAPEGTVIIAQAQTAGRGRMGRSFHAPAGLGLYFSLILRPKCNPNALLHLTCAAAKATCDGVENCIGFRPQIKWTNDLIGDGRKLGGILTELSVSSKTGLVEWAVIGIGINCNHSPEDFPPELQDMASSLKQIMGRNYLPSDLAAHLMQALYRMNCQLFSHKEDILKKYRQDCITVGQQIMLVRDNERFYGTALDVDSDGGLTVRLDNGAIETVQSGEVSVRGLYGYI